MAKAQPHSPMYARIPAPTDQGRHSESTMMYLFDNYQQHLKLLADPSEPLLTVEAERYACGFPLPSFQRPLVWSQEQRTAFIESAWLGLPLGSFNHHQMDWARGGEALPFSGWLIDGQQRLSCLQAYWEDAFPIFGLYWSELNKVEKRRFMAIKFTHYEVALNDEAMIRELYNRLAFGGTPHTFDQRA